jgi:hypothetical protein
MRIAIPPLPQYPSMARRSVKKKHRYNFTFTLSPNRIRALESAKCVGYLGELKVETVWFSEKLLSSYVVIRYHNAEGSP